MCAGDGWMDGWRYCLYLKSKYLVLSQHWAIDFNHEEEEFLSHRAAGRLSCLRHEGASRQSLAGAPNCHTQERRAQKYSVWCPSNSRTLHANWAAAPHLPPWLSLPLSPPLFVTTSVQTMSPCILNEYFSVLSPSVYKSVISKDLFLHFEAPLFFLFLPELPISRFVMVKVPQSPRTLLIHTNDCPLFDVIENACTSCWEEWKKK